MIINNIPNLSELTERKLLIRKKQDTSKLNRNYQENIDPVSVVHPAIKIIPFHARHMVPANMDIGKMIIRNRHKGLDKIYFFSTPASYLAERPRLIA